MSGPLDGVRILDLSVALTCPYAVALLGDQGAEVIKVERPGMGDIGRWIGVSVNGMTALYQVCNRGKRSIAIDFHTGQGRDIVKRLAAEADVVVENFRPGVLDRVGLGFGDLAADRDDLVYASLSGFGAVGPYAGKSAYDTVVQAYAGVAADQADPTTGVPRYLNQTVADKVTALVASQAITAALFARERGAGGQHLELSMLDAVVSFLCADAAGNEVMLDADGSRPSSFVTDVRPYRFTDGWGICTPASDADFAGLCRALGVEGHDDPRVATIVGRTTNVDAVHEIMDRVYEAAAGMSTAEAIARMEAERVPCGVVLSTAELADDVHVRAVGLLVDDVHPHAGPIRQPRHPTQFASTPAGLGGPASMLGEHTAEILTSLGLGDRIAGLMADGVVA